MSTYPIPFAGGSYKSLSLPYSAQTTKNMFFEVRAGGRSVAALHGMPGLKLFGAAGDGRDRGLCIHKGILYRVTEQSLYSVSSSGVATLVGLISGSNQCVMVSDSNYLVIATGGTAYTYDETTLAEITDTDLESPYTVTYNNSRAIYDGAGSRFCVADVGQPSVIDGLNYATAEASPGQILAVKAHKQYVFVMCSKHIEPWFDSGVGSPPYDRVNGGVMQIGLGARYSVDSDEDYIYFLDNNREPRRLAGITLQNIGNPGLTDEFRQYSTIDDAKGFCFSMQKDRFYVLSFPSANRTWMYQESINEWLQLSHGQDNDRHRANSYAYAYNKHIVADWETGTLYEWDLNTYSDNGDAITRERTTQPLFAAMISPQLAGKEIFMTCLELVIESGVGLATGQGVAPVVMMQFSDDGGATWSGELWESAGVMGARHWRLRWYNLGNFVARVFRFRCTDPVKWSFLSCHADLDVGV